MRRVGIVRDPLYLEHANLLAQEESPARLRAIDAALQSFRFPDALVALPARDATHAELVQVHDEAYVRQVEQTSGRASTLLDPDTAVGAHSFAAAVRAAGGVLSCVEAVMRGSPDAAFALVRPPGHHAEAGRAMGFCLFNNVAVAAQFALQQAGLDRVLIVDWDVHHGNGTMHSFYDTDRVLFFSTHQYPHYPGSGRIEELGSGDGQGFSLNVPLPAGLGDEDYSAVFERVLMPVALEYRPQLLLVSAGFDILSGDPLGDMHVSRTGIARLTGILLAISAKCCPGRIVLSLEGGYNLRGLASGVEAALETLVRGEAESSPLSGPPAGETERVIDSVVRANRPFWRSLR